MKKTVDGVVYELSLVNRYGYVKNITPDAEKDVRILSTVDGIPIVDIDDEAFMDATTMETLVIPHSIVKIGGWAFDGCRNLKEVQLNGMGSIEIGSNAFARCYNLEQITGNRDIVLTGNGVFKNCKTLFELPMIKGDLPNLTFFECQNLKNVRLRGDVNISYMVFSQSGVETIHMLGTLRSIEKAAMDGLKDITFVARTITPDLQDVAYNGIKVRVI